MHAGFARREISAWLPGMTMMGWGVPEQQATGVQAPLFARAMFLEDEAGATLAVVVVELMAVSQGMWLAVLDRLAAEHPALGLGAENLAMVATHTHSGPSGYSHHFWVNLSTPGFCAEVYDSAVEGVVQAIVAAAADRRAARLRLGVGEVPREAGVAFNRSWFAYSRNHDTEAVPESRRDEAVDRELVLLTAEGVDGELLGLASWFGLHGTCLHREQRELHPDHKGLAACALEAECGVALMAQGCCGDVTPNHRYDPRRGRVVGAHDDDHRSAEQVAAAQVEVVRGLLAGGARAHEGRISAVTTIVDFDRAPVAARYAPDGVDRSTTPARIGLSMAEGTAEGPGPLFAVRWLNRALTSVLRRWDALRGAVRPAWRSHDPKVALLELSRGDQTRLAGLWPVRWLPAVDPIVGWIRQQVRAGAAGSAPWLPTELPVQLVRVGGLVVCMLPFEVTTVAGRRVRATLREVLPVEVEQIVVCTYANAYAGYLTTYEEYQVQHYEAGYTVFGPFALGAVQTAVEALARRLLDPGAARVEGRLPERVPRERLEAVAFRRSWTEV